MMWIWSLKSFNNFNDSAFGGHSGYKLTYRKVKEQFYWKGMQKEVKRWVPQCDICQKNKPLLQLPDSILQALAICMDFIIGLPKI